MAACSPEIDSTVFLRWRQASPTPAAEVEHRRQQLREDFRRQFGVAKETQPPVTQPKQKQRSPTKVNKQVNSDTKRKAAETKSVPVPKLPAGKDCQPAGVVTLAPPATSELRYLRLLSPGTRANRWMHTTWHHLPPNPDTSRGICRASHFNNTSSGGAGCGHFRIHPDWGWDAPLPQPSCDVDSATKH